MGSAWVLIWLLDVFTAVSYALTDVITAATLYVTTIHLM